MQCHASHVLYISSRPRVQVLYGCLWLHERYSSRTTPTASTSGEAQQLPDASSSSSAAVVPAGSGDASAAAPKASATAAGGGHGKKVLSEPLSRTLTSVRSFSRELSRLGVLITFAYMCENHPPFAHGEKVRLSRGVSIVK